MNGVYKIVGTRGFSSNKDGKNYVNVFCTYQDSNVAGVGVDKFFVREEVYSTSKAKIGDMIIPVRNEKGFINSLYVIR